MNWSGSAFLYCDGTTWNQLNSQWVNGTAGAISYNGGNVGIGTTSVASAALLELVSTTKGFLPPRMTTAQRDAIASPATGLQIYNTTTNALNVYNGTAWGAVGGGGGSIATDSDVTLTSVANNDILRYDSATSKWKNVNIGSAMNTTTMVSNWPDAIMCNGSGAWAGMTIIYYYTQTNTDNTTRYRFLWNNNGDPYLSYNTSTGAFVGYGGTASDCQSNGWTINQLYTQGRAFNFIGSSLSSAAAPAGGIQFNNGSGGLAGDTALVWDNTNKRLGIGTTSPGQKLTVAGTIESTSGGIKFPDGTTQTTAATAGGISARTTTSCTAGVASSCTTPSCPTGYFLSGCTVEPLSPAYTTGWFAAVKAFVQTNSQCQCINPDDNYTAKCVAICLK